MAETGLHSELEARLSELAKDIAELRRQASRAKGVEKIEQLAAVEHLEHRYQTLEEQLRSLDTEAPGFGGNLIARFEETVRELTTAIEDWMLRTDSGYRSDRRREPPPKH